MENEVEPVVGAGARGTGGATRERARAAPLVLRLDGAPLPVDRVGGKAAPLSRALAAGHPVPDALVIPVASLDAPRAELDAALARELASLGEGPYAVRSSAVAEDGASRSFAGQLHTELGVPADGVAAAVDRCVRAASALRALRYAGGDVGRVAVIVQRMVPARAAGVAFGADPRTGERGVVCIEAVDGLGEALVSGEATPEAWRVAGDRAAREHGPSVLTEEEARRVAALVDAMSELFGAPQDVEWAFEGDALRLLQSRPITALPAAPVPIAVEPPKGTWERDDHHGVLSPLGWHWFQPYPRAMGEAMRSLGVPVERMDTARIGGHLYMQMVMGGGDGPEPPAWVLWLVTRLLPSMRRANRAAARFWDAEEYWGPVDAWEATDREAMRRGVEELFDEDLRGLSDEELLSRIDRALALTEKGLTLHAWLGGAPMFALGKLALFLEDRLGWAPARALDLLAGSSPETTWIDREVGAIVEEHATELEDAGEIRFTWSGLAASCPRLARALSSFVATHRLRMLHYDPKHPMLGERPELVLGIAESWAARLAHGDDEAAPGDRAQAVIDEARAEAAKKLDDAGVAELDRLIAGAKRGYAIRDANGVDAVSRPAGLLRYLVIELGRRLGDALEAPEHAVYLEPGEHRDALAGRIADLGARVTRRRGEEAWALVNRGPAFYGKKPGMPPVDAFPPGLRRVMRVFSWMDGVERRTFEHEGSTLRGFGVGAGRFEGRVRVIDHPEQLVRVRVGEVVVCRITSPEWSMALGRAGALVTEEGGALSHPAIIAREMGVPAVVGVADARKLLRTGQRVVVDAGAGTVVPREPG